jgi:hypothetical protein
MAQVVLEALVGHRNESRSAPCGQSFDRRMPTGASDGAPRHTLRAEQVRHRPPAAAGVRPARAAAHVGVQRQRLRGDDAGLRADARELREEREARRTHEALNVAASALAPSRAASTW